MRKTSERGIALIKSFEGCVLRVYRDAVGLPTVGYGHMDRSMEVGKKITQQEADYLLAADLQRFEWAVESRMQGKGTQNQFDAFVSLSFNIGSANFAKSSALRHFLAGNMTAAADAILLWNKARGKVLPGLIRRRKAERALFLGK